MNMRLLSPASLNPGTESDTGDGSGTRKDSITNTPGVITSSLFTGLILKSKDETQAAKKSGQQFQPEINFYDQFSTP